MPVLSLERTTGFRTCHERVELQAEEPLQFIDVTELVRERVRRSGVLFGTVNVQTHHTTTAVVVNENEPLLLLDLKVLLERWAPCKAPYRHDDLAARTPRVGPGERPNGHAHARALVLPTSVTLNVADGRLQLGTWQSVFLVELDGLRPRTLSILVMGLGA